MMQSTSKSGVSIKRNTDNERKSRNRGTYNGRVFSRNRSNWFDFD